MCSGNQGCDGCVSFLQRMQLLGSELSIVTEKFVQANISACSPLQAPTDSLPSPLYHLIPHPKPLPPLLYLSASSRVPYTCAYSPQKGTCLLASPCPASPAVPAPLTHLPTAECHTPAPAVHWGCPSLPPRWLSHPQSRCCHPPDTGKKLKGQ